MLSILALFDLSLYSPVFDYVSHIPTIICSTLSVFFFAITLLPSPQFPLISFLTMPSPRRSNRLKPAREQEPLHSLDERNSSWYRRTQQHNRRLRSQTSSPPLSTSPTPWPRPPSSSYSHHYF